MNYYFSRKNNIELIVFNKYTIDKNGVIRNDKGNAMAYRTNKGGYYTCGVYDDNGKQRQILVGRTLASTFLGPPPTPEHTVDHKNKNTGDDTLDNIRWLCKSGQSKNRVIPETLKTAFVVVKNGEEKTVKEWVEHLKGQKLFGREYSKDMIKRYAREKQYGFLYKKYSNLPEEVWKEIVGSNNKSGRWEISNMNRVKYITKHAENVLSGERLGLTSGYPIIRINGRIWLCHILAFLTFFPEDYAAKKSTEMILHEDDDKTDFRPQKLRLGTRSVNAIDARVNGKYDGTKTAWTKCASYVNDKLEKEYESQDAAVKYLRNTNHPKASFGNISMALNGYRKSAYGRTWKLL